MSEKNNSRENRKIEKIIIFSSFYGFLLVVVIPHPSKLINFILFIRHTSKNTFYFIVR